jgi:hypothetical protein
MKSNASIVASGSQTANGKAKSRGMGSESGSSGSGSTDIDTVYCNREYKRPEAVASIGVWWGENHHL